MTQSIAAHFDGKVIVPDEPVELPVGQPLRLQVELAAPPNLAPGEGIRRSAGAWAEDGEELDKYLEWNRQQRKMTRRGSES